MRIEWVGVGQGLGLGSGPYHNPLSLPQPIPIPHLFRKIIRLLSYIHQTVKTIEVVWGVSSEFAGNGKLTVK